MAKNKIQLTQHGDKRQLSIVKERKIKNSFTGHPDFSQNTVLATVVLDKKTARWLVTSLAGQIQ